MVYSGLGGIRPDEEVPGFNHFCIAPGLVGELDYVNIKYSFRQIYLHQLEEVKGTIPVRSQRSCEYDMI